MKPVPFARVNLGDIFNDIDGTTFIKTGKALTPNKDEAGAFLELNCMILIPNKPKDNRGQLRYKSPDTYCEILDPQDILDSKLDALVDSSMEEPGSNE